MDESIPLIASRCLCKKLWPPIRIQIPLSDPESPSFAFSRRVEKERETAPAVDGQPEKRKRTRGEPFQM